jgi:hypothetical protein
VPHVAARAREDELIHTLAIARVSQMPESGLAIHFVRKLTT